MSIHKKQEIENLAAAFESVMHTVAHGEAYRQVSDVLKTVNANAQRIDALETTDEVLTKADLDKHVKEAEKYLNNAVSEMVTPHDKKVAELEMQVARLERQMTQVIALFEFIGQESQNLE